MHGVSTMSQAPVLANAPRLRTFGAVNWIGLWTLYVKEVRRFFKVFMQTVAAPVVTTLLFLAIFLLALGGGGRQIAGVPYVEFLVPGLVMMAITQNAFANTSSCVVVGLAVGLVLAPLAAVHVCSVAAIAFYGIAGSAMMSLLGILGGLWADKFDHLAAVTNFVVTPLTFLSGTFYSVGQLPETWRLVAHLNPFFYMIDGFRYGFTGTAEGSLAVGVTLMIALDLLLLAWCHRLFVTGYKLKA